MTTVQIVIDVAGESAGSPGEARTFAYSKIDPTPPLVTLSLGDDTGVTSYEWEIVRQPAGATAILSSTTDPSPTFTPTASVAGTYLVACTVNGGTRATNAVAFLTEHLGLRKPAPTETDQFNDTRGWEVALAALMDEVDFLGGVAEDARGARRRAVIDIVDCTVAPPTEVTGDRYILDFTAGTVHAAWDWAPKGSIVEFGGSTWGSTIPNEGWVAYVDMKNSDYRFVDDGTPAWESASADGQRRRAVIDIVDCTAAPPTEVEGDRYIVDDTAGTIHGDWDSPSKNDIVEFNGTVWNHETPIEGWAVYIDAEDEDYRFVDDGVGSWEIVPSGREAVFPDNHIWVDFDNGSDSTGDGTKFLPYKTLAVAAASIDPPADFAEYATPIVFHVGPGTYSGAVTLPYRMNTTIIGYGAMITGAISWNYKFQYLFGQSKYSVFPVLLLEGAYNNGLILGNVTTKNADNTQEALFQRLLFIKDCVIDGHILNLQSECVSAANCTGALAVYIKDAQNAYSTPGNVRIGGERETSDGADTANTLYLVTTNSTIAQRVCGCTAIRECFFTAFLGGIDYSVNPVSGAGSYAGNVGGSPGSTCSFRMCAFSSPKKFGWDGVTGGAATAFNLDIHSWTALTTHTLDNVTESLFDQAVGLAVDNSGWSGNLGSEEDVQAALDTIDGLKISPTIYDDTTTFTDVAASGGTSTVELDIGAIDDGIAEAVQFTITAGTSADTTIQLYNGDPSGGSIIYEAPNLDLVTEALDDRNCWYVELPTTGELWVKITNDGGSISSYSLRLRIKGDV